MNKTKRRIFYVSDGTGITATNLGRSLLTQFESVKPEYFTFPYVDTVEKIYSIREKINASAKNSAQRPIIFATLLDSELRRILSESNALFLDLTGVFIGALEKEFQVKSSLATGLTHSMQGNIAAYEARMRALNFALRYDDGVSSELYERADIILVGASRSGKTPACLYLAMQFGIAAANYPLTEDHVMGMEIPEIFHRHHDKLFGLTIHPERLHQIRQERHPHSRYASLAQCELEVQKIEALCLRTSVPMVNVSKISVEEIAAIILQKTGLKRVY